MHEKPYAVVERLDEELGLVPLKRACQPANRSYNTLLQGVYRGSIPHVRIGRSIYLRQAVVDELAARNGTGPTS